MNTVHDRVDLPTTPIDENTRPNRVELTPLSFLERAALAFGARTALVHGEHRYTYRDRCVDDVTMNRRPRHITEDDMSVPSDLLTIAEAAERLGLTREAIRRAAQRGLLDVVRLDQRTYLVPADEIARYRDQHLRKRGPKGPRTPQQPATPVEERAAEQDQCARTVKLVSWAASARPPMTPPAAPWSGPD